MSRRRRQKPNLKQANEVRNRLTNTLLNAQIITTDDQLQWLYKALFENDQRAQRALDMTAQWLKKSDNFSFDCVGCGTTFSDMPLAVISVFSAWEKTGGFAGGVCQSCLTKHDLNTIIDKTLSLIGLQGKYVNTANLHSDGGRA